jgi:hypothetical protein
MTEENIFSIIWQKWSDPFGLDDNIEIQDNIFEEFDNFVEESELEDLTESNDSAPMKIEEYLDSK